MTITEIRKDLFNISNNEYYYVHCISADYALGAGIAVLTGAGAGIGIGIATSKAADSAPIRHQ